MALIIDWMATVAGNTFYQQIGQRIAQYRKAQNLTQQQLAEKLGIAQQTLAHYEGGHLRVSVEMLSTMAKTLSVTIEELIGEDNSAAKNKRGPASTLQRQIENISSMPRSKQKFISEMLEALIKQQQAS